jgi:hypothetical protein
MTIRLIALALLGLACVGCSGNRADPTRAASMLAPTRAGFQNTFTRAADWSGDGRVDGIEATVELVDAFGDTTKSAGRFIFELYAFDPQTPGFRGRRVINPWVAEVNTPSLQRLRWNATARAYTFRLEAAGVREDARYVLTVTFEPVSGRRLFDETILGPTD